MEGISKKPASTAEAAPTRFNCMRIIYCLSAPAVLPSEDPAKSRFPSAVWILFAFMVGDPFLAREPATVIVSPTFTDVLFQPLRYRPLGGPNSHAQSCTFPSGPAACT